MSWCSVRRRRGAQPLPLHARERAQVHLNYRALSTEALAANMRGWLNSLLANSLPQDVALADVLKNGLLLKRVADALLDAAESEDQALPRI